MGIFGLFAALLGLTALLSGSFKPTLIFFSIAVACYTIAWWPPAPKTAREVQKVCVEKRQPQEPSISCMAEVYMAFMDAWSKSQRDRTCVFDASFFGTDLTREDPRFVGQVSFAPPALIAVEWMNSHPEKLDEPAYDVVGEAIAQRFPCRSN